jgi:hypothetical protein
LRFKPGIPPNPKMGIAINNAVKEWIKANMAGKVLDCAYNVMPNHTGIYGMGITNANSLDEAFAQLTGYPPTRLRTFKCSR